MFITTEETPNPLTLKFIPVANAKFGNDNRSFSGFFDSQSKENHQFNNVNQASKVSPLAMQIFQIKGVDSVFIARDFVTITRNANLEWQNLKLEIIAVIIDFIISGEPFFFEKSELEPAKEGTDDIEEDNEIVKQIKELIEIKVRPAVAMDGGDIIFHSFVDGIVRVTLKGSCSGCPSSTITLKSGIEQMLKHYVPEVVAVEQVEADY